MGLVFLGGVHGVGKTTICEQLTSKYQIDHYSASNLIRSEQALAISRNSKKVSDVDSNQNLLLNAVSKLMLDPSRQVVLDGHFTLVNDLSQVQKIAKFSVCLI